MNVPEVRIFDIMACDVYWDFDGTPLPREQHKFLVSFHPTPGVPTPELVESITARGPDGYEVVFGDQRFTAANTNGHIYDRTLDYYWYMVNLPTGFLPEGEYTIEVLCIDGRVLRKSRTHSATTSRELVEHYKNERERILASYSPSGGEVLDRVPVSGELRCDWATLDGFGGPDAYYIHRLAEGGSAKEFDTQNLTWWDNIFVQRLRGDERAGLNRGGVDVHADLRPETTYSYFVEITDANAQSETNICVFQPHQVFRTPARVASTVG
ncbi:hypothetical protein [Nocardiopsis lambiniae]|uniref:Uncharacterized protein n=1 Tax=Nocardiopsis lambiniae TaxID=3075539 RepID=A0ABU2M788_9ACTN|nr:hypothetical protein [Nocardiopsis sp. DSM 44743]MDT0328495.1 hypothetical protein [Nocardiopsis sp. DSM 44743]